MHKRIILSFLMFVFLCSYGAASCGAFIKAAEEKYGLPTGLLEAIVRVESRSTPWAVNTDNASRFFKDKTAAITYIRALKSKGTGNINVGCAQLNLRSHGHYFKGEIGHILDPNCNVHYAARLLRTLYNKTGSWEKAVRLYNSPSNGTAYQKHVFRIWSQNQMKENPARLIPVKASYVPTKQHKIKIGLGKRN